MVTQWTKAERRWAARPGADRLATATSAPPAPPSVVEALAEAQEAATPHQLPIAVLGGGELGAALVVLRLTDCAAWFSPDGNSVVCLRAGALAVGGGR